MGTELREGQRGNYRTIRTSSCSLLHSRTSNDEVTIGAVEEKLHLIRWPFDACAEIYPENSTRILTKVKEISLHGCYLEYAALPKGTRVFVKIFDGSDFFEANANVIFAQPEQGLGLAFRDVKPYFLPVLQKWLAHAMKSREA